MTISPRVASNAGKMEEEFVAETVDDSEMEALRMESGATKQALQEMNREVEALREELQRKNEEENAQRRRGKPLWHKVCCLASTAVVIGAIAAVVVVFTGRGGRDDDVERPEPTSDPTAAATTVIPDVIFTDSPTAEPIVFDPPTPDVCSAVAEGRDVDGQDDMGAQAFALSMSVYQKVDISSELWIPSFQQSVQELVMPPMVGCGNSTLDVFFIGNAQVDQDYVSLVPCKDEEEKDGSCYVVEMKVNVFLKQIDRYPLIELNQYVEEVFQNNTDLVVEALGEDYNIKDIGAVTSMPLTESPSQQPSNNPSRKPSSSPTDNPSVSPSLQPTNQMTPGPTTSPSPPPVPGPTLPPKPGPTVAPTPGLTALPTLSPTPGPTLAPASGPTTPPTPLPTPGTTIAPTPGPSTSPTLNPTPGPSQVPSSGPTESPSLPPSGLPTTAAPTLVPSVLPSQQPSETPSSAPTTKRMAFEDILSRFAPFDGNKTLSLDWLVADTWEPPTNANDETQLWEERFALGVLYFSTNGVSWNNNNGWLTSTSVCSWNGITGCNAGGSVTQLELWTDRVNFNLVGDLPDEMRALTNLEIMRFGWNRDLSGPIPSFLSAMTKLTDIHLGDTGRTGSIPPSLWTLTKLQVLRLSGNRLNGAIPPGISALTDIRSIGLPYNDLTGTLPDEFSGMTGLTALGVQENFLAGSIPPLPSSLSVCNLAIEGPDTYQFAARKTEGNCFTDTINAPGFCNLSANQC